MGYNATVTKPGIKSVLLLLVFSTLTACGGGKSSSSDDTVTPVIPEQINTSELAVSASGVITISGQASPNSVVNITFPDGSKETVTTDSDGNYSATSTHSQPPGDTTIISISSNGPETMIISPTDAPTISNLKANSDGSIVITGKAAPDSAITAIFPDGNTEIVNTNSNGNYSVTSRESQPMGEVFITSTDNDITSAPTIIESNAIEKVLYLATGVIPKLSFTPSVGVNTEAPQGGADTAGMPMPFADIFRTARPFAELSAEGTILDENGWVVEFADESEFANGIRFARTKLLQGTLDDSIPEGQYTVIYEGEGILEFGSSGAVSNVKKVSGENKYTFDLNLRSFDLEDEVAASDTNAFNMNVKDINTSNPIKNIRIAMPGGTCAGNPFIRVDSQDECPDGDIYESFAERLAADRNAIIFNPDYLAFLRNFKVVRMMNLMEASLKKLCFTADDCPEGVGTWDHRAKLEDAVWGGNDGRTSDEDHKGVPIEVMIALANTLQRDIWVNMPHVADNDYVKTYAKYVHENLDTNLKAYVEYSNEVWNPGFSAHSYAVAKGTELGYDTVPEIFEGSNRDADYFARLRFYSKRAEEIFILWKAQFDAESDTRLVRVLGSFIGDKVLTEQMLKDSIVNIDNIDAVAIAPYFFGCPYEAICIDAENNLLDATTVDDVFAAIDQSSDIDVKSLDGTIEAVKSQLTITGAYNLDLVAYEGGQHLVTGVLGSNDVSEDDKARLRGLFNDANRDPRMKQRYITFLDAWKDLSDEGTALFTLYTLPQSYYRFGNFGMKEHLNMSRLDSPKFDGVMTFQEAAESCWWDNCE
ncbi:hypothetical protein [uncultured Cocleimonas sp.]|uniref:hypothetical protein n=1 Tax=uncultured Cocleimonas sp. TaxID=1051587 RepID=UPI002631E6CE|nr:hypothetical protein [uncultured Cocleimonas sp.]